MTRGGATAYGRPIEDDPLAGPLDASDRDLLRRMPKAELHLHLDGSLRPATALDLARERGVEAGATVAATTELLVAPARCRDQADLLRAFDLPIAILQDRESLARVTHELVEDVASEGTRYVEIRWGPGLHLDRGLSLHDGIAAVADGARSGAVAASAAGRPVVVRLIAVALRSHDPARNEQVARAAVAAQADGVSGFDLAGLEAAYPDPLLHARAFAIAREAGLGVTIHAGEWGGAEQVRRALVVEPSRIAHGAPAGDDPGLMAELVARNVTLDICPTSNVQADLRPTLAEHPLPTIVRAGVPVTLSTDDRTVSALTLTHEYARCRATLGLSPAELWRLDRHALTVAFLDDESLRARLLADFDAFADAEPALGGAQAG
ncbi:MAG TPA: adenosine deaminase [Candidatus Limnocylindrales bacterium]